MSDGVTLEATSHPIEVTGDMIAAGLQAYRQHQGMPPAWVVPMIKAVYEAMAHAAPELPDDIHEEALENVEVLMEHQLPDEVVEQFAMRCAMGNPRNRDTVDWPTRLDGTGLYTEDFKEYWRQFVRELALQIEHSPVVMRIVPEKEAAHDHNDPGSPTP